MQRCRKAPQPFPFSLLYPPSTSFPYPRNILAPGTGRATLGGQYKSRSAPLSSSHGTLETSLPVFNTTVELLWRRNCRKRNQDEGLPTSCTGSLRCHGQCSGEIMNLMNFYRLWFHDGFHFQLFFSSVFFKSFVLLFLYFNLESKSISKKKRKTNWKKKLSATN